MLAEAPKTAGFHGPIGLLERINRNRDGEPPWNPVQAFVNQVDISQRLGGNEWQLSPIRRPKA
jgi:hypothetical protein